jgi:hypothetical protein
MLKRSLLRQPAAFLLSPDEALAGAFRDEARRPIGARDFHAYRRTGSKVVNKAALRCLRVK